MTDRLPVPVSFPLRAPLPGTIQSAAAHRGAHLRRPRLERVTCLDYQAGLLAAAGGRVCCVWDTRTHELRHRIVAGAPIVALSISGARGVLAVAAGLCATVHDLATGDVRLGSAHAADLTCVHMDDAATVLASADCRGIVQVSELRTGRLMQRLQQPPGRPIVFVHHGRYVVIESHTHTSIVDAATGELLRRFPYDTREPLEPRGLLMPATTLLSHSGPVLRFFDCSRHAHAHCVHDLGSTIVSIDICNAQRLALAATEKGELHLFDRDSGARRRLYESFTVPLMFARFGPAASLYVAGGEPLVMQLEGGRHVRSYRDEPLPLVAMTLSPQRQALLVTDRDGGLTRFRLQDGRVDSSFTGHVGSVSAVKCCGELSASGAYDGTVRVFDGGLRPRLAVALEQGPVQAVAFDPVERRLWAGTWTGKVNCLDLDTGGVLLTVDACSSAVRTLAFDARRTRLCVGGNDGELVSFALTSGVERLFELRQPGVAYRAVFDDNGDLLVTANDGVRRYAAGNPALYCAYEGSTIRWFERAGDRLYSLSLYGVLSVFDTATREELHRTAIDSPGPHRSVVVLNPDRVLTAAGDGFVRVFDGELRLLATLEVLRAGFLWSTVADDGQPGWLHTNRPELVDVGEPEAQGWTVWDRSDTRRARHLAVWHSGPHVMRIVHGGTPPARAAASLTAGPFAGVGAARLGFVPSDPAAGAGAGG